MNRRSTIWRKSAVYLALALACASPLGAQQGERGPSPTLQEALDAAYARSPQLQVLQAREAEVGALRSNAASLIADNPAAVGRYQTDRVATDQGLREYEAGVALPLWRPGQRGARQALADTAGTALDRSVAALRLTVAGQVREAIWNAALAENNAALARQEWETELALERDVQRRVELGEAARTDLLLARDETLRRERIHLQAQAELAQGRSQYRSITGLERLPRQRGERRSDVREITGEHPLVAAAEADAGQARARVAAVREGAAGSPELVLSGKRQRAAAGQDFVDSLDVTFRLPFGVAAHTGPRVTEAARTAAETQAERDTLVRRLALALQETGHALEASESALLIAEEQNRLAQENLRLARTAFAVGETDLVGLLRVQNLAFAAQRGAQELRIVRERAIARYNQAAGVLP
ncbi:MAG: TolC family protein [Burkholderiales bacterium]|nr:TolC family protein [Burkholderiales bacterium]